MSKPNVDFEKLRADTFSAFADLQGDQDLPDLAIVDFFFVPQSDADWDAAAEALWKEGFDSDRVEDEEGDYLAARIEDHIIAAQAVAISEEVATLAVLPFGFLPDGWGFEAD